MECVMGGLAACGACLLTNPLDVVKTRLQLQGELKHRGAHPVHYRDPLRAFFVVARNDGLRGLQKGLVPALWYQWMMNGTRLGLYHYLEKAGVTRQANGSISPSASIVAGAVSGTCGAFVASPFQLVKTHLQSRSDRAVAVGFQHEHSGFRAALRSLYGRHGLAGLWRGVSASVLRVGVGSAAQLSTFTQSRQAIDNLQILPANSWLSVLAASMLSGVAVALCMTPMDVVSTRLYNQGLDSRGRGLTYDGFFDCARKIRRAEGLLGFYKGGLASYLRVGPHTVLTLMLWTRLRQLEPHLADWAAS